MPDKTNLPARATSEELIVSIAANYTVVDPEELEGRTLLRTLTAETATQVLAGPESQSLDEMTGEPFWLVGIDFFTFSSVKGRESDLYAYIDCYHDDGRGFQVTTGSPFVISRVHRLGELGVLPRRVMSLLVESKRNQGQSSLWIVDAPKSRDNGGRGVVDTTGEIISDKDVVAEEPF
jgi:hypothetical protein